MKKDDKVLTEQEYSDSFPPSKVENSLKKSAFKQALDVRKYEIDLYWKRAQYFWTFIAATFAGYAVVLTAKDQTDEILLIQYALICLGLVFSVAWYFVNRGSKYWQLNWEKHVDMLEKEIIGPLFKTTINKNLYKFWNLFGPYPFSVTRINHIINIYMIGIWLFLGTRYLMLQGNLFDCSAPIDWNLFSLSILTLGAVICFWQYGKGSRRRSETSFQQSDVMYQDP